MPESNLPTDGKNGLPKRRRFTKEFKEEVVHMHLDGHSAASIAERLTRIFHPPIVEVRWRRCSGDG